MPDDISVIDKVALGGSENTQDIVVKFLHQLFVLAFVLYQLVLVVFQLALHLADYDTVQLLFQTFFLNREVYQSHLRCHLGFEAWVGKFAGHIQSESIHAFKLFLSGEQTITSLRFLDGFVQHRLESNIYVLLEILEDHNLASIGSIDDQVHVLFCLWINNDKFVFVLLPFHFFQPFVALQLRVDQ